MTDAAPAWPDTPPSPEAAPAMAPSPAPALALAPPTTPDAMLDMTMPLQPVGAATQPHEPYPTSLAMPHPDVQPDAVVAAGAGATAEAQVFHVQTQESEAAEPAAVDASGTWWSPGTALVAAMLALAWQLVAYYAHALLPQKVASGAILDRFDTMVDRMPIIDGAIGSMLGMLLAAGALGLLFAGYRRGLRETVLQVGVGAIAGLALVATLLLPKLVG